MWGLKVRELIDLLKDQDPEAEVLIEDTEGSLCSVATKESTIRPMYLYRKRRYPHDVPERGKYVVTGPPFEWRYGYSYHPVEKESSIISDIEPVEGKGILIT